MNQKHWLPLASFLFAAAATSACAFADSKSTGGGYSATGGGTGGGGGGTGTKTPGVDDGLSYGTSSAGSGASGGGGGNGTGGSDPTGGAGGAGGTGTGSGASGGTGGTGGAPQCDVDMGEKKVFFMSADDSASMGSAELAREFLNQNKAPPPALIRIYEFLNYYRVRYPLPADKKLEVHAHLAPAAATDTFRFQIGVQAFDVTRPTMALTFVVDTSGSLVGEGMTREKAAVRAIAKQLHKGDHVNFVTWAAVDSELLADHVITGPDDAAVLQLADKLAPSGGSDLHAGLEHGYKLATKTQGDDRLSRVVLISDGGANLGITDRTEIEQQAKNGDDLGIYLVGIGLGPAQGYSDALMNAVTDAGRGSYVYLDSAAEAESVLGGRFDEVMDIAARAVRIKVTLPSYFDISAFYGKAVSMQEAAVQRQHLAPADSMILSQEIQTGGKPLCGLDTITVDTTWDSPLLHKFSPMPSTTVTTTKTLGDIMGESYPLHKAEAIVAYAKALRSQKGSDFTTAGDAVTLAKKDAEWGTDPYKAELDEIETLLSNFPPGDKKN